MIMFVLIKNICSNIKIDFFVFERVFLARTKTLKNLIFNIDNIKINLEIFYFLNFMDVRENQYRQTGFSLKKFIKVYVLYCC